MRRLLPEAWLLVAVLGALGCKEETPRQHPGLTEVKVEGTTTNRPFQTPDWAATASIYEVNVRQFTPEGTFAAMRTHLPRLKRMGVDVIWFMPIYPISELRNKGSLGSYYSIGDFRAVNPAFGTLTEFREIVDEIHALDMHVILDWTANHTGWDHAWITEHPEFYIHREGSDTIRHAFNPQDPSGGDTDWYDIAQLDYSNMELRDSMVADMQYWLREVDIDGFRCDVAGFVPNDFWMSVRPKLETIKPVFMLAEWGDEPAHFDSAFDINYGWGFHQLLNEIAQGNANADSVWAYQAANTAKFPPYAYHLNFTSNHDENSWNGTEFERLGELADAMWVVCATFEGAPLIYSGQEEPLRRRLAFFDKDDIGFEEYANEDFFRTLLTLKQNNRALANGAAGGRAERLELGESDSDVLAFRRAARADSLIVAVNFSGEAKRLSLPNAGSLGSFRDVYAAEADPIDIRGTLSLPPHGYLVLTNTALGVEPLNN